MTKKRAPDGRTLIPLVGAAMAAVAAGNLVLFSVFAQRTALSPGSRGVVVPHAAPAEEHEVVKVPTPRKRMRVTNIAIQNSGAPAIVEDSIAQGGPVAEGFAPPSPDEPLIVASVDVGVPVRNRDEQPRFSRPPIRFARNLDPPGPEEPDEEDPEDEEPDDEEPDDEPEDPETDTEDTNTTGSAEELPSLEDELAKSEDFLKDPAGEDAGAAGSLES